MLKFFEPGPRDFKAAPGGGRARELKIDGVRVRIVRYPAGAKIPKHTHTKQALHLVTKGRLKLARSRTELHAGFFYECGGSEYGPWLVLDDAEMIIIESE